MDRGKRRAKPGSFSGEDELSTNYILAHGVKYNLRRIEHINAISGRLAFLQSVKHIGSPLQQRAIEHIVPIAAEVAGRTQAAILHLNGNRTYLFAPHYTDHVKVLAAQSGRMKVSVDTFLELADAQQKVQHIEDRLEQRLS